MNTEIDNTLFDVAGQTIKFAFYQGIYMQKGFNDAEFEELYFHPKLFTQVNKFFDNRGSSPTNVNAVKQLVNNFSLDVADRTRQLRLLNNDEDYFNANQAAGMPNVGSAAWKNTLKFSLPSPNNGLIAYNVEFLRSDKSAEALFAREFAKNAADKVDQVFNATVGNTDNMTNIKMTAFANFMKINGGFDLGTVGNRKAALLSYNAYVEDVSDPTNFTTIFNNRTGISASDPDAGEFGSSENLIDKRAAFDVSSFRSLGAIRINGVTSPTATNLKTIEIVLSIVDVKSD